MVDDLIIRARVWRELSWAANFVDNSTVLDLPLLELITMQVYVQPQVVRATEYILDRIPEFDPQETDDCRPIVPYPYVSDRNTARLDNNPMSPVPRKPADTIVERTGKQLRAVLFVGGSPSPDISRTVYIAHENITKPWKSQLKYQKLYRNRAVQQRTSVPAPALPSTTDKTNQPAYDGSDLTPVKFRRLNTFTALHNVIMATAQHVPAKIILDSGAGISGVGAQWKLTDISRMSSMSIQGAFGDSMRPSIQVSMDVRSYLLFSYLE